MTRPRLGRRGLALLAALGAVAGCGGPAVTAAQLEGTLASTFAHLYAQQQTILGHQGATAAWADPSANCRPAGDPGGPAVGGDWTCAVTWRDWNGTVTTAEYDVTSRPDGCYTATGPATVVGAARLRQGDGQSVVNPVLSFDGCFPTS